MRWIVGIFGLAVGAVITGLAARYGYATSDVEIDAWIMAFVFGTVTAGALGGHAIGLRLWRADRKTLSVLTYAVAIAATMLSLSTSLGAIAGRSDKTVTERAGRNQAVETAQREIARLEGLRSSMAAFVPTDATALAAAKTAADAAQESRRAECERRGPLCRDREADERKANDRFAEVAANKSATDRAMQLEGDAESHRVRLGQLGSVVTVNVQGTTFAKLLRWGPEESDFASTLQNLGLAVIIELMVIMCLMTWEALGPDRRIKVAEAVEQKVELVTVEPVALVPVAAPKKPSKAIAKRAPSSALDNAFVQVMSMILEPTEGGMVSIDQVHHDYVAACKVLDGEPLTAEAFVNAMVAFCAQASIQTMTKGRRVFMIGVQVAAKESQLTA